MMKYFVTEKGRLTPLAWIVIIVVAVFAVLGVVIAPRLAMHYGLIPEPTATPTPTVTLTPTITLTFTPRPTESVSPTVTPVVDCRPEELQNPAEIWPDETERVRVFNLWYEESGLIFPVGPDAYRELPTEKIIAAKAVSRCVRVDTGEEWVYLEGILVFDPSKGGADFKNGYARARIVKIIPNTLTPAPVPSATVTLVPVPTHTPTTTSSVTPLPGQVFISGVNWIGDRYIALSNIGGGAVDISRWSLRVYQDGVWVDAYLFGVGTAIAADQTLILHFGIGLDNPSTGDYYWWRGQLPANYGTVKLFNNYEATVWVYDYGATPTPTRTSTLIPSTTATTVPSITPSVTALPTNTPPPTHTPKSTDTPLSIATQTLVPASTVTLTSTTSATSTSTPSEKPVATVATP